MEEGYASRIIVLYVNFKFLFCLVSFYERLYGTYFSKGAGVANLVCMKKHVLIKNGEKDVRRINVANKIKNLSGFQYKMSMKRHFLQKKFCNAF